MAKKSGNIFLRNFRWVWFFVFSPFLVLALLIGMAKIGWLGEMPDIIEIEDPSRNLSSVVYTQDNEILGKYFLENRVLVNYEEISPNVFNALIPTEDIRFYDHSGIDARGTLRAIKGLGSDGGASTITQQLAKLLFHKKPKSRIGRFIQKIKEWVIAVELEHQYTKKEILTMYLNQANFGHNIFGIYSASKTYYNKSPKNLTVPEAAMIVGLLKGPSVYSPLMNYRRGTLEVAVNRRNTVLEQMKKYGKITEAQFQEFKKTDIIKNFGALRNRISANAYGGGNTQYFLEELKKDVQLWCEKHTNPRTHKKYNIYTDGLKIYTTIDSRMQRYAEQAVVDFMPTLQKEFYKRKGRKNPFDSSIPDKEVEKSIMTGVKNSDGYKSLKEQGLSEKEIMKIFKTPRKMTVFSWNGPVDTTMTPWDSVIYHKFFLTTGLMCMDPHSGEVKAWVGGIDYTYFKYDHVRAGKKEKEKIVPGGGRQVGSTFKPFVYAMAMREGRSPCEEVPNVRVCVDNWCPDNSGNYPENVMVSLRDALAHSINYISAYLIKQYGAAAVVKFAHEMGITSQLEANPAICLGTPDISVYEMVAAYSVFFNKGIYNRPIFLTRIEDRNGNVLTEFTNESKEAMNEQSAFRMVQLMSGVKEGTGSRLNTYFPEPVAGKTGTSQSSSDGWFIAGTPDLVCGVWTGGEDRGVRQNGWAGGTMALPMWGKFMRKVYDDRSIRIDRSEITGPNGESSQVHCVPVTVEE